MRSVICVLLIALIAAVLPCVAHAGEYTIYDCPAANGSTSAGPWTISGGDEQKTSCDSGAGDFIGPLRGSMSPNSSFSMTVNAPGGETLKGATVWWLVPHQSSGANMFAKEFAGGTEELQSETPYDARYTPDTHVLPAGTTSFSLVAYCASDDYYFGCSFRSTQTPEIEMHGSAITVSDPTPPSGSATGGALAGSGAVSGTQSISYDAADDIAGVRAVQTLVDGQVVATSDYNAQCPYTNFLACTPTASGTLSWDTASVPDGAHDLSLRVINAAGDWATVDDHTLTTSNPPSVSPPSVSGTPATGQTLSASLGGVTSDPAAGSVTSSGQWLRCDASGGGCAPIAGAEGSIYNPAADDVGSTLRFLQTSRNDDGSSSAESAPTGQILAADGGGNGGGSGISSESANDGGSGSAPTVTIVALQGTGARWAVSLRVWPLHVHQRAPITLSGRVSTSPRPTDGKLVYLEARAVVGVVWRGHGASRYRIDVYGAWTTFGEPLRANRGGEFSARYRFRRSGRHTYEFRAIAPQEGGFRNPTGTSRLVTVSET